jgi:predicted ferric reductase
LLSGQRFRPFAAGHWVVMLLYALVLLLWIVLAAEAAYQQKWVSFTGYTCVALFFLTVPTGVLRRLARTLRARKPPSSG